MKIQSLKIKKGFVEKQFIFTEDINLIYSRRNSVGKTTLLRLLMFSLGYNIPSTKGMKFDSYELFLNVIGKADVEYHLYRARDYMVLKYNDVEKSFSLPNDIFALHEIIFGISNEDVLNNLLGTYYVDQEKGWTLLNRGKVIGNNHFSIESFILGLSKRLCKNDRERLGSIEHELQKYQQMSNTAKYQKEINELSENISFDTAAEELEKKLDVLRFERKPIDDELNRLKSVIRKNKSFKNYISSMKLRVRAEDGSEVPVNEKTLIGFVDNMDYIITKRKITENELVMVDKKIKEIEKRLNKENVLFDVQTMVESFDADIAKIHIDYRAVESIVERLEKERKILKDRINESIKFNNPVITELHMLITKYAVGLGINEKYISPNVDYIFTSDLKSLTGAILHKIVFAFKLAYIKMVYQHTGTQLPIILDSPSGREVDKSNVKDMMELLIKEFKDHQIIIASIFDYGFTDVNIIVIENRLLDF